MKKTLSLFLLSLMAAPALWSAVATTDIDGKMFFLESKLRTNKFVGHDGDNLVTNSSYYDADHVWKFESAGSSTYYIQNVATGQYVGGVPGQDRKNFTLVDKAQAGAYTVDFTAFPDYAVIYDATFSSDKNALHADDSSRIVRWTKNVEGSAFSIIDASNVVASLDKFYTIKNQNSGYVSNATGYKDNNGLKLNNSTAPTDFNGLWHKVEMADGCVRFINAGTSAPGKVLGITGSEAGARANLVDPAGSNAVIDFVVARRANSEGFVIKLKGSDNNYWNARNGYLALWNNAGGANDNGSTFYIVEADPDNDEFYRNYAAFTPGTRPEYIHDFALWYDTPVSHSGAGDTWMEYALPLGNGQIGATIRGGVKTDEIQLNEKTLWAGNTQNNGQGYFQNLGSIFVKDLSGAFSSTDESRPVKNYARYLDIIDGTAGVSYQSTDGLTDYQRRYFVSATDSVLVARYEATGSDKLNVLISFAPDNQIGAEAVSYTDASASFSGKMAVVSYNAAFKVVASEGATVTTSDSGITVSNADWAEVIMAARTDYDATKAGCKSGQTSAQLASAVASRISAAEGKGYDTLLKNHTDAFSALMNRVSLSLGTRSDKTTNNLIDFYATEANRSTPEGLYLESLYFQYGRYLTIGANLDGSIHAPSNLQGIWNDRSNSSFWHCDIHADINVQMNYWPADPTNLSEMHRPFIEHIIDMASAPNSPWKALAQKIKPGARGWTVAVENNIFGGTSGWENGRIKTLGAWYCTHIWRYYQYSLDRELLARALPVMYEAALFIKDISTLDSNGLYEIKGEWSPEHGPTDVTAFAQQCAYELLDNLLDAHAELGSDSPLTAAQLAEIEELHANFDKGLWTEQLNGKEHLSEWKNNPLSDHGHRHLSHLMCLYPFAQVSQFDTTAEGNKLFLAAYNSQVARNGDVTGWSMGWQTNIYARSGDGNLARMNLSRALGHSGSYVIEMANFGGCYYNLFDAHSPFQIDGNYGCTSGVTEMLLQSFDNAISLLPALPDAWANGSVTGLKAQGDYTVDINWQDGRCVGATITNNRPEARTVTVRMNGSNADVNFEPNQTLVFDDNIQSGVSIIEPAPEAVSNAVFDLLGRRVNSPVRGINIVNGHKVLVK